MKLSFIIDSCFTQITLMNQNEQKNIKHTIKTELDDFGRKRFTLHEQQDLSHQENEKFIDMKSRHNSNLIAREEGLDIEKYIGKIENAKKIKKREVFYCEVCEQGFKCDIAYITHCNSPAHNRKLGMNMKVKGATMSSVAKRIQELNQLKKNKKDVKMEKVISKFEQKSKQDYQQDNESQLSQSLQNQQLQPQIKKQAVKSQQMQKIEVNPSTLQHQQKSPDAEQQMMKAMGLPTSFGSKKRKRN